MTPIILNSPLTQSLNKNGGYSLSGYQKTQAIFQGASSVYGGESYNGKFYYWTSKIHPTVQEYLGPAVDPWAIKPPEVEGLVKTSPSPYKLLTPVASLKRGPAIISAGTIISLRSTVASVDIHDLKIESVSCYIDSMSSAASVSNGEFKRIEATKIGSRGFIRLRGRSSNLLFEDIKLSGFALNTSSGDVPAGICLVGKLASDAGENIVFRRVSVDGINSKHGGYLNGDGIATEAGYSNVRYENVRLTNNVDSGLDNKARNASAKDLYLEGNGKNAKLWYNFNADGPVYSHQPKSMHLQFFPKSDGTSVFYFAELHIKSNGKHSIFCNGTPQGGKMTIIVDKLILDVPEGTPLKNDPYNKINLIIKG